MLTATELRRMVKAHNKLMDMVIPPKTNRDGIIKLIEKNGFKVDHDKKKIVPSIQMKRKPTVKLPPAPPKKTEEEKKAAKDKRSKREQDRDQVGYDRVVLRKGEHKMPDGSVMKDKDMPKKELKEIKLKGGGTLKPYVKPVKKAPAPKPVVKKAPAPAPAPAPKKLTQLEMIEGKKQMPTKAQIEKVVSEMDKIIATYKMTNLKKVLKKDGIGAVINLVGKLAGLQKKVLEETRPIIKMIPKKNSDIPKDISTPVAILTARATTIVNINKMINGKFYNSLTDKEADEFKEYFSN